jgi:hypothetical protein
MADNTDLLCLCMSVRVHAALVARRILINFHVGSFPLYYLPHSKYAHVKQFGQPFCKNIHVLVCNPVLVLSAKLHLGPCWPVSTTVL